MALVRGIDISAHQDVTSWSQVARDVEFCIVKASEGEGYVSSAWPDYFAAARRAGLLAGSYHFAGSSATRRLGDPVAEASHYVGVLRRAGWQSRRDLPPVLDIEVDDRSRGGLTDWCLQFVRTVDDRLGLVEPWLRCGVYCNRDFHTNRLDGARLIEGRWWWQAWWPDPNGPWPGTDLMPAGAAIWQWTDAGVRLVDGIDGAGLDLNAARRVDVERLAPKHYRKDDRVEISERDVTRIAEAAARQTWRERLTGRNGKTETAGTFLTAARSDAWHAPKAARVALECLEALGEISKQLGRPMSDAERGVLAADVSARVEQLRRELSSESEAE